MSSTALMTFAEFEQLPDAPGKRELIDGELVTMPPPQLRHSTLVKRHSGCCSVTCPNPASGQTALGTALWTDGSSRTSA
jgi:hypothetical protein